MLVPETAVDKYGGLKLFEDYVWGPWESFYIFAEAIAATMQR